MSALSKKQKFTAGFSLVEILVVIGILGILTGIVAPKVVHFYNAYQMDALAQDLVQTLRSADMRSMQSEGSSPYSVHLITGPGGSFTLFRGTNYAARDTSYDEMHPIPSALSLSYSGAGPDISFTKIEGLTTNTGSITLSWPDGNQTRSMSVGTYGVVDRLWQ